MNSLRPVIGVGAVAVATLLGVYTGCSSDTTGSTPAPSVGGSAGAAGKGGATTGGAAGTGGSSGTGGVAGAAGTGGSAGAAGTGGTAGTGGVAGAAGQGGSGTAGDHVLISEIGILGDAAEFIELWNPTGQEVDLSDYYVADNSAYYKVTSGPWNPTQTAGTDFLVRFPAGTKLAAGGILVIGVNPNGYETAFGSCPTLFLNTAAAAVTCGGNPVAAMLIPPNGSLGDQFGALLSNNREMVILFTWDGTASTVKDVDYVTWGDQFDDNSRADKTGVTGYQADTTRASQKGAPTGFVADAGVPDGGGANLSIERCTIESGEKLTGGNGLTGHDETSEELSTSFKATQTPTPGVKSTCLP